VISLSKSLLFILPQIRSGQPAVLGVRGGRRRGRCSGEAAANARHDSGSHGSGAASAVVGRAGGGQQEADGWEQGGGACAAAAAVPSRLLRVRRDLQQPGQPEVTRAAPDALLSLSVELCANPVFASCPVAAVAAAATIQRADGRRRKGLPRLQRPAPAAQLRSAAASRAVAVGRFQGEDDAVDAPAAAPVVQLLLVLLLLTSLLPTLR